MSNGYTDPYSLENVGFQQIMGAGGGGQNLQSLIQALYGTLREAGHFGTTAMGENQSMADLGYGRYTNPNTWGSPYDVEKEGILQTIHPGQYELGSSDNGTGVMGKLEQYFGEGANIEDPTDPQKGMQALLGLLKKLDIPGMTKEYGQNIGDVQSEIGSQLQALIKNRTVGGKAGRYSNIASGGRNIKSGGRDKYMSDYYGLQEEGFTMQQDLQKRLEEDVYSDVGQFMQFNPVV